MYYFSKFKACHEACKEGCFELGPSGCNECKEGWIESDEKGCLGKILIMINNHKNFIIYVRGLNGKKTKKTCSPYN